MSADTSQRRERLLPDAALRHRLLGYALAEQHQVASQLRASHPSRSRGEGLEFRQFRPYLPGDDLRRVDWRVFGRTDRYYVREAEQESRLTVCLLVDTTASMGMADESGPTRLQTAVRLAAALAWLANQRHHDLAIVTLTDTRPVYLPPAAGTTQWQRVLRALSDLRPSGDWPRHLNVRRALQALPTQSKVFFFSDCLEHDEEQARAVTELLSMAHALTTVQILLAADTSLPGKGQIEVVDAERGDRRIVDARRFRREHSRRMQTLLDETQRRQLALGARFVRVLATTPLPSALHAMLAQRLPPEARLLVKGPAT